MAQSAFSFGKKDSSDSPEASATEKSAKQEKKEEIQKDHINIDFLFDTKEANPKNRFNWSTSSAKYKDSFDAVSGASKFHSTKYLRETVLDKDAKDFKIPKGLYCLCLYAVSNSDYIKTDDFKISQEGKKLTITFNHRGNSYKIESDENGELSVPESFYLKQEKKTEEAEAEQEFTLDEGSKALKAFYKGKLKAELSAEGLLTVKGKLNQTAKEVQKEKADEPPAPPAAKE